MLGDALHLPDYSVYFCEVLSFKSLQFVDLAESPTTDSSSRVVDPAIHIHFVQSTMIDIRDTRRLSALWTFLLCIILAEEGSRVTAFVPASTPSSVGSSSRCCRSAAAAATATRSTPVGSRRRRRCGSHHGDTAMATMMASSVAPAARTKAEKKSEHFKLKEGGVVEFGSGQRVEVRT